MLSSKLTTAILCGSSSHRYAERGLGSDDCHISSPQRGGWAERIGVGGSGRRLGLSLGATTAWV